ncbi:MAG: malto-oligosyltrehalose trehalohydrolase [Candidatus Binatus sp.]|uniref:malto-oligosyltrehalose trehalohydrolase n=1 Tax=Candidatus Binatus sp. TaxID=2811406 RepID=UPI002722C715|nr:malto-oligosyltrehalose trehalohydrolase [Candidatus Binatus sp.]MDO8432025.1 malto-oligosyltrehalose trehalohydrolase [Candidatus Binatus sp.]
MYQRRLPIGAEIDAGGSAHFRVWAPKCKRVCVAVEQGDRYSLARDEDGYFAGVASQLAAGSRYRFQLDDDAKLYPDPCSRFQPEGPHGPSELIDPLSYRWSDSNWKGCSLSGQVIYELHVGTFTPEGTWTAAAEQLEELAKVGITVIEMMPVADFAGSFGWGYDGVDLFAPYHCYGRPDDLRAFIDRAHQVAIGVILDVVYNHIGPDGNYLKKFADDYFTDRYRTDWGEALNFEGRYSGPVREFFTTNARYWIEEFHFDGLRLDATQQIIDSSPTHILTEVGRAVRKAAGSRATVVVAENELQDARQIRPVAQGGYGLDAMWNDDFHHTAMVAMTGQNEAYYTDYGGRPQEFISCAKHGFLYQGQRYAWRHGARGGAALGIKPEQFITFIQNHDQVANSVRGERCHFMSNRGLYKAMTALLLLTPNTPMLFQGQEFAANSSFMFFADHQPELAAAVREGRGKFMAQFPSVAALERIHLLADPSARETFLNSKLDFRDRERNAWAYRMHRDLLALRRGDRVFASQARSVDGAVLDTDAFLLRFFGEGGDDRLLLINLGRALPMKIVPEPLIAPPADRAWRLLWSSESGDYLGSGAIHPESERGWRLPGFSASVLASTLR